MINGIIYKCNECEERFFLKNRMSSIDKAPCPYCDKCTIKIHKDKRKPINSDVGASDLFKRIDENGR